MKSLLLIALFALFASTVFAKRAAPQEVQPVTVSGIEYRAPLDAEKIGIVQAWSIAEKKLLWEKKVYSIKYDLSLERDVQWVFITKLQAHGSSIVITNERGERFSLDPTSRKVTRLKR